MARHNYSDLITAAGVLESFDVLNHKENQKHEKKSIFRTFFTYIYDSEQIFHPPSVHLPSAFWPKNKKT